MTLKPIHFATCAVIGVAVSLFSINDAQAGCRAKYSYIGDTCLTAAPACPENTLIADGSLVSRFTYSDLFTVIGYTYGKDEKGEMFALPDLAARAPVGTGEFNPGPYGGGHQALGVGIRLGKLRTNQTSDQLAYHTHEATISTPPSGGEATQAAPTINRTAPSAPATGSSDAKLEQQPPTITISPAGQGADTYIVAPRLTMTYCVMATGADLPH